MRLALRMEFARLPAVSEAVDSWVCTRRSRLTTITICPGETCPWVARRTRTTIAAMKNAA